MTPPSKDGERWRTNYTDRNGKRKTIRAQTEEALPDKLIPLYLDRENLEKNFQELFEEWIAYKAQITTSPNTILRHRQHFKKYIASSRLYQIRILKITEILLETECNRIVKDFNLSNKEWVNLKTILNGMFEYAYRMKYLQENLNIYLDEMYEQTSDVAFIAVKMNFFMGLRVGELVALKWEDICEGNQIHIVREEVRDQVANKITVADHTKTHTDRFVYLIPDAFEILAKLLRSGEYIFMRDGKRLTSRQINYVLEKYAERFDLQVKSSHKLRKTYASMCNANDVPIDFIREQLGHASLCYKMLIDALSRKRNAAPEQETVSIVSAQKPDKEVA